MFIFCLLSLLLAVAFEDDELDKWAFQRQQGPQEVVHGSHSISGAVSTPDSPIVLVKALKTMWTYMFFPQLPRLYPKHLISILEYALWRLTDLNLRLFSKESPDMELFT